MADDGVLTEHNDQWRTGSIHQPDFTPSVFERARWGVVARLSVDAAVHAQPLFVPRVPLRGGRRRNLLVVATAKNTLYGYDADSYALLWRTELGSPDSSDEHPPYKDHPCVWNSVGTANFRFGAPNPSGPSFFIGIQSTPTIDRSTYRAYVSYRLGGADDSRAQQWLAAIDVKTGRLIRKTLTGQAPHFELKNERQRASLLLDHGLVFVAFGSRCEELTKLTHLVLGVPIVTRRPYHGWIFAHDANTLNHVGSYNVAPGRMGAGVWQASGGLAADESGRVYFISGNFAADANTPDPTGQNLGNSFVRLDVQITARQGIVERADMRVGSWFTPYRAKWQNDIDLDLGSAGPVLIPRTNYVVGGGKEGVLYLLNRDNLGGFAQAPESALPPKSGDDYSAPFLPNDPRHDRAVDEVQAGVNQYKEPDMNSWPEFPHIHGSPVYADLGNGRQMIYVWAEKDYLKGFDIAGGRFHSQIRGDLIAPTWNGMPGGMLSVSVDPSRPGQGVVFASVPTEQGGIPHGALHAYDAARLGGSIWTSQELYLFARFVPPTVAGSKVYLATWSNEILVFGSLRPGGVGIISWNPTSDWGDPHTHTPWSLVPPGSAQPGALAAVARTEEVLDVFWIGPDGGIGFISWKSGWNSGWGLPPWPLAPPGSAQPGALAAVARTPEVEDVFWIGPDGGIGTIAWNPDLGWGWGGQRLQTGSLAPPGSAQPGALAAVARTHEVEDVMWVGPEAVL